MFVKFIHICDITIVQFDYEYKCIKAPLAHMMGFNYQK